MVWVGQSGVSAQESPMTIEGHGAVNMWSPASALAIEECAVDFDAIVRNIKQLNIMAGEGSSEVTRTPKGAQLKVCI